MPDSQVRVYRTVYRRQRDLVRPAQVYSASESLDFAHEDLAYLRSGDHGDIADAWIETRIEHPWDRLDVTTESVVEAVSSDDQPTE